MEQLSAFDERASRRYVTFVRGNDAIYVADGSRLAFCEAGCEKTFHIPPWHTEEMLSGKTKICTVCAAELIASGQPFQDIIISPDTSVINTPIDLYSLLENLENARFSPMAESI